MELLPVTIKNCAPFCCIFIAHLDDQRFSDAPAFPPVIVMRLNIWHVVDANVIGSGFAGGDIYGPEIPVFTPFSESRLRDKLNVMNELDDAQVIMKTMRRTGLALTRAGDKVSNHETTRHRPVRRPDKRSTELVR